MLWLWTVMALAADPVAKAWNAYELELWEEARDGADEALATKLKKAERSTVLLVSATARQHLGDDAGALASAEACVALGARDADPCKEILAPLALQLGKVAFNEGIGGDAEARARAVERFQTYVAVAPDQQEGQLLLGRALALAGRPAEALGPLKAAVALEPTPEAVGRLVGAQAEAGELDAAITTAGAHELGEASVGGLLALGQALQPERPDEAIAQFRAAVKADPGSAPAHKLLGVALVNSSARAESNEEAREALVAGKAELEAALAIAPDDAAATSALEQVDAALGE